MGKKQQIRSKDKLVSSIKELNKTDFNKIKKQLTHRSKEDKYKKLLSDLQLILEGQKVNRGDLQLGFIGLAKQNSELLDLNKQLTQQLKIVVGELNVRNQEREEKAALKEARAN